MKDMEKTKDHCSNCKYWKEEDGFVGENRTFGDCRRYPPKMKILEKGDYPEWPGTYSTNWCGEWEVEA